MSKKLKTLYAIAVIAMSNVGFVQNLVPNPSFEDTLACPNGGSQIFNATGWSSYRASPEYFNSCSPPNFFSVPDNFFNFQAAAYGYAYAGIITYAKDTNYFERREMIGRNLSQTLIIGQKYFVSFKANLVLNQSLGINLASNKLGVLFTTSAYSNMDANSEIPINNNFAHVYSNQIISDTANWTTISGSFVADSAYNYLSIGNFFFSLNTDTLESINDTTFIPFSYYFIDDICVSTDSTTCVSGINAIKQIENQNINVYPNPVSDFLTIHINQAIYNSEINLVDVYGKSVYSGFLNQEKTQISLDKFESGVYILKITDSTNRIFTQKIFIDM